jgi:hypothetical protein
MSPGHDPANHSQHPKFSSKYNIMTDSKLKRHEPPGNLNDFTEANKDKWSKDYVSYWMDGEIRADPEVVGRGRTPLTQFFDGTQTAFDTTQEPQHVEWNGFPKLVSRSNRPCCSSSDRGC